MPRVQSPSGRTWIDPEEYAYPAGSIRQSRRKGKVLCADGRIRTATLGIPDTFFSIPARVYAHGKTVAGYVHVCEEEFCFSAYRYRKNFQATGDAPPETAS
jgi:hypothetical protein